MHDSGKRDIEKTGAQSDPSNSMAAMELLSPFSLWRLSEWLGKGANKYAPRNWEKGIKFSVCIGKLKRHLEKHIMGEIDEDHLAAVGFWWHALSHYEKMIKMDLLPKELDDMPKYEQVEQSAVTAEEQALWSGKFSSNEPTIECVPEKGWQIRLANGMFLHTRSPIGAECGWIYNAFAVPFYYISKETAERRLADYLRSKP